MKDLKYIYIALSESRSSRFGMISSLVTQTINSTTNLEDCIEMKLRNTKYSIINNNSLFDLLP